MLENLKALCHKACSIHCTLISQKKKYKNANNFHGKEFHICNIYLILDLCSLRKMQTKIALNLLSLDHY